MKATNVFDKHREKIAKDTLRMVDAAVGVMGGMVKAEARHFLRQLGYSEKQIENLEK